MEKCYSRSAVNSILTARMTTSIRRRSKLRIGKNLLEQNCIDKFFAKLFKCMILIMDHTYVIGT